MIQNLRTKLKKKCLVCNMDFGINTKNKHLFCQYCGNKLIEVQK